MENRTSFHTSYIIHTTFDSLYWTFGLVLGEKTCCVLKKEPTEEKKHHKSKSKKSKDVEKPNISYPTKFTHVVHVGFDDNTGEFTGMPDSWIKLLENSNISLEMQKKNPQAVLDALNYFEHTSKHKTDDKFMTQAFGIVFGIKKYRIIFYRMFNSCKTILLTDEVFII